MLALVASIHVLRHEQREDVDGRDKPDHDGEDVRVNAVSRRALLPPLLPQLFPPLQPLPDLALEAALRRVVEVLAAERVGPVVLA